MNNAELDHAVLEQALEILRRLPADAKRPLDHDAVRRFAASSEQHRLAMARLSALWEDTGNLQSLPWPTQAELDADTDTPSGATAAAQPSRQRRTGSRGLQAFAVAAALAAIAIGIGVVRSSFDSGPTISTNIAEHRDVRLPDESEVTLGGQSVVQIRYSARAREIVLSAGEALFTVRENPSQPFIVHSGEVTVGAVGTVFDVCRRGDQVVIAVVQGIVRVTRADDARAAEAVLLRAGERVSFDTRHGFGNVRRDNASNAAAWRSGWMVFDDEDLANVISDISRYSAVPIVLADERAQRLRYTGTVRLAKSGEWVDALAAVFPVQVHHQDDRIVVQSSGGH